ncbi:S8 family serine peptidase [Lysobacter fragariae]
MNSLHRLALALVLVAAAGLAHAEKLSPKAMEVAQQAGKVRVLVMLDDQAPSPKLMDNLLRRRDVASRVDASIARLPAASYTLKRRFALVPGFALEVNAKALERLRDDPAVSRIDIDAPGRGSAIAPDESSDLNHVSALQGLGYAGTGMKVAVIDSGVDTDHPDLASQLVGQQCFCSNASGTGGCCPNGQATQSGAGAAEDAWGHGTNVAGIIVGKGNVAPRGGVPSAQLVAVRVLDAGGSFCCSSDVVAAMDWVASNHPDVDVVNLSLGTAALFAGDCDTTNAYTQALATAVNNLVAKGAMVVVSSGNQGNATQMSAPACVRDAMSVGATWDSTGGPVTFLGCSETSTSPRQPTCFSNHSTTTDIYAAGAYVTSAGKNGGISTWGGTSQAAPMVSACAIALKQEAPYSTVAQRMDAMKLSPYILVNPGKPFLDCTDALKLVAPKKQKYDFDKDGRSDVFWRNGSTGANDIWKGANSTTRQAPGSIATSWSPSGIGDFDGDRKADILFRDSATGKINTWRAGSSANSIAFATESDPQWKVVAVGDFNGDSGDEPFWRHQTTGANRMWPCAFYNPCGSTATVVDQHWKVAGAGDFNGDGADDILWRNDTTGGNDIWRRGLSSSRQAVAAVTNLQWTIVGVGDFNGDGKADILWRNSTTGANAIWLSAVSSTQQAVAAVTDLKWQVAAVGDYNSDGKADILWRHATAGDNVIWYSGSSSTRGSLARVVDLNWKIVR